MRITRKWGDGVGKYEYLTWWYFERLFVLEYELLGGVSDSVKN